MISPDVLLNLKKQLYPEGRAFKVPIDSNFEKLLQALNISEEDALNGIISLQDDILPDNTNFDAYDCTQWERRLGLVTNTDIPLADRKLTIRQKMAYPGINNPPRQSASFIQYQLRQAGYDVYVYQNRFFEGSPASWITKTPNDILGTTVGISFLGSFELGTLDLGSTWMDDGITICANYLEEEKDAAFDILNYRQTFYVAGDPINTFANVDAARKDNFRQLILNLKPAQTAGILFVNYV